MLRLSVLWLVCAVAVWPQDVSFSGSVVQDHSGEPVAGAVLRLRASGAAQLAAELESDGAGRFQVEGLKPGDYDLALSKKGYLDASIRVTLSPAASELSLRMVRCGAIAGRVTSADGTPIADAMVFAVPSGGPLSTDWAFRQNGGNATTNARGEYRLFSLPPGSYRLLMTYGASLSRLGTTGWAKAVPGVGSGSVLFPDNQNPLVLSLSGGEEIANADFTVTPRPLGTVTGKLTGIPPPTHGWVTLTPLNQTELAIAAASTDDQGQFQFEGVPEGAYWLLAGGPATARGALGGMAFGEEVRFQRVQIQVTAAVSPNVEVELKPGRSTALRIIGVVPECGEAPEVQLLPLEQWGVYVSRRVTVKLGTQVVAKGLAPGRYGVRVTRPSTCRVEGDAVVDLSAERNAPPVVDVKVGRNEGVLQGRIGTVIAGAPVRVALMGPQGSSVPATLQVVSTDGEGRFTFASLVAGVYRVGLCADAKGGCLSLSQRPLEIQVEGGRTTSIELKGSEPSVP